MDQRVSMKCAMLLIKKNGNNLPAGSNQWNMCSLQSGKLSYRRKGRGGETTRCQGKRQGGQNFFEPIRTKIRTFSEEIRTIRTIFEKQSVQSVQFF